MNRFLFKQTLFLSLLHSLTVLAEGELLAIASFLIMNKKGANVAPLTSL